MTSDLEKNKFFDINKLPPEKGLLLFGLSMSKLLNRQDAAHCLEDIRHFTPFKVSKPLIGLDFIYTDFLYLYGEKSAPELKNTFMNAVIIHRNGDPKADRKKLSRISDPARVQLHRLEPALRRDQRFHASICAAEEDLSRRQEVPKISRRRLRGFRKGDERKSSELFFGRGVDGLSSVQKSGPLAERLRRK